MGGGPFEFLLKTKKGFPYKKISKLFEKFKNSKRFLGVENITHNSIFMDFLI